MMDHVMCAECGLAIWWSPTNKRWYHEQIPERRHDARPQT